MVFYFYLALDGCCMVFDDVKVHSYFFYPFNLEFCGRSCVIVSINSLLFVMDFYWWNCCHCDVGFDIVWHATMWNKVQLCHQTTATKKYIVRVFIKWSTIDLEIDWTKWVWIDPYYRFSSSNLLCCYVIHNRLVKQ